MTTAPRELEERRFPSKLANNRVKAKGDPYFVSCRAGAEEAARELGVELIWDGPTSLDAAKQNELVESWITRHVDVIAVAVENRAAISTVLRKARERGIRVITWDADAEADARDFFVNQATAEGIANALTDEAARLVGGTGEFAIITGARRRRQIHARQSLARRSGARSLSRRHACLRLVVPAASVRCWCSTAADLKRPNLDVAVQEDFGVTGRTTLEKLDAYIRHCDAVIHLIGKATGGVPEEPAVAALVATYPDFGTRLPPLAEHLRKPQPGFSYTQAEAYLAIDHRRDLYVDVATRR